MAIPNCFFVCSVVEGLLRIRYQDLISVFVSAFSVKFACVLVWWYFFDMFLFQGHPQIKVHRVGPARRWYTHSIFSGFLIFI